ncbi:hypothetical protein H9Y04_40760 [Streptomyces sp. TRM66268-LWL]|uniref:Class IIb bacteriocin, lactobin A/cerein 7B family n=1 Tax=Streptomyces polyasparticus TaxID=2767826 RepID=A0ABR7SVD7_9ACTN|nr:daptide-type RiPP [Streptomyces polyasparticus]MBC9718877.1 hypothetical protein [Streptomyces polyasparticus]MBC9718879.1 hypothetical protein [Streptomyces polyasparticus]
MADIDKNDEQVTAGTPDVELEMQELEALEAPGFWTGVSIGASAASAVATSIALT